MFSFSDNFPQKVEKPLEFLGLYKTRHSASSWNNIPAHCLSGMIDHCDDSNYDKEHFEDNYGDANDENEIFSRAGDSNEAQILEAGRRYMDRLLDLDIFSGFFFCFHAIL